MKSRDLGPIGEKRSLSLELQQTTRAFQAVMNNAPVGILFTKDRLVTRYNHKFCEMFGFVEQTPLGVSGRALFLSDGDYAELGRLAAPLLSAGLPFIHEMNMARQDGSGFWAQLVAYVLNPDQASEGTIWLISDRSREKQREQAIQAALFENQAILDNALIGIVFLKNRIVQRCNPYVEQLFGYAPGSMVGTSTQSWYANPLDFDSIATDFYPTLSTVRAHTRELIFRRQSGELFWGRASGRIF